MRIEFDPKHNKVIQVGDRLIFREGVYVGKSFGIYRGNCIPTIGSFSYSHSSFNELIDFTIGNYCSIAENVQTFGFEHDVTGLGTSPIFYHKDRLLFSERPNVILRNQNLSRDNIAIKNDVWIGRGALFKRGITIGNGAVIGAVAIVTKDIADYQVVGGNPAKLIKPRFPEKVIAELLDL